MVFIIKKRKGGGICKYFNFFSNEVFIVKPLIDTKNVKLVLLYLIQRLCYKEISLNTNIITYLLICSCYFTSFLCLYSCPYCFYYCASANVAFLVVVVVVNETNENNYSFGKLTQYLSKPLFAIFVYFLFCSYYA